MTVITDYVKAPFVVAVDTREQAPWQFMGFRETAKAETLPLLIPTETVTLQTGDYSVLTMEDKIGAERKSIPDFCSSLSADRERFERELRRMQTMIYSCVIVEGDWQDVADHLNKRDLKISFKSLYRSVIAFTQDYPYCHWFFCQSREMAEHTCYRILERFHRKQMELAKDG